MYQLGLYGRDMDSCSKMEIHKHFNFLLMFTNLILYKVLLLKPLYMFQIDCDSLTTFGIADISMKCHDLHSLNLQGLFFHCVKYI